MMEAKWSSVQPSGYQEIDLNQGDLVSISCRRMKVYREEMRYALVSVELRMNQVAGLIPCSISRRSHTYFALPCFLLK